MVNRVVRAAFPLLLAACGGGSAVRIDPDAAPVASRWNATLGTPAELVGVSQVRGSAWMAKDPANVGITDTQVAISNAAPGGVHPWHVHRGTCGNDQGILGPADAYRPLRVDENGAATAAAELPLSLPTSGQYFVNVHASPDNLGTIIACGNLAPPSR